MALHFKQQASVLAVLHFLTSLHIAINAQVNDIWTRLPNAPLDVYGTTCEIVDDQLYLIENDASIYALNLTSQDKWVRWHDWDFGQGYSIGFSPASTLLGESMVVFQADLESIQAESLSGRPSFLVSDSPYTSWEYTSLAPLIAVVTGQVGLYSAMCGTIERGKAAICCGGNTKLGTLSNQCVTLVKDADGELRFGESDPLPYGVMDACAGSNGERFVLAGGSVGGVIPGGSTTQNTNEVIIVKQGLNGEWQLLDSPNGDGLLGTTTGAAGVLVGDTLVCMGGEREQGGSPSYYSSTQVVNMATGEITAGPELASPSARGCARMWQDKIVIVSGAGRPFVWMADIEQVVGAQEPYSGDAWSLKPFTLAGASSPEESQPSADDKEGESKVAETPEVKPPAPSRPPNSQAPGAPPSNQTGPDVTNDVSESGGDGGGGLSSYVIVGIVGGIVAFVVVGVVMVVLYLRNRQGSKNERYPTLGLQVAKPGVGR